MVGCREFGTGKWCPTYSKSYLNWYQLVERVWISQDFGAQNLQRRHARRSHHAIHGTGWKLFIAVRVRWCRAKGRPLNSIIHQLEKPKSVDAWGHQGWHISCYVIIILMYHVLSCVVLLDAALHAISTQRNLHRKPTPAKSTAKSSKKDRSLGRVPADMNRSVPVLAQSRRPTCATAAITISRSCLQNVWSPFPKPQSSIRTYPAKMSAKM